MARCYVTGFAGFIGSHLTDRLIELGHEVVGIDNLSTGKRENINPKAEFINWDVSEVYFNARHLDYVFHLAAIPRVLYSIEHPTKTHRANVNGTFNILKAAKDSGAKKFIFASSSSVYGDQDILPLKEDMTPRPKSPYALHKLIGEQYCKLFNELYGLPTVSLRFFNVYGPRADDTSEYSLVIAKFLKMKKEGKPLTIYDDGEQTRDFTYVSDTVEACIKAMEMPVQNEIINVCAGKNVSVNKIAEMIGGEKVYLPPRPGDPRHTLGDNTKAKKLLNWEAKIGLEEGFKRL